MPFWVLWVFFSDWTLFLLKYSWFTLYRFRCTAQRFSMIFFFFLSWPPYGLWSFWASNQIQAIVANLSCSCSSTRTLTRCVRWGLNLPPSTPKMPQILLCHSRNSSDLVLLPIILHWKLLQNGCNSLCYTTSPVAHLFYTEKLTLCPWLPLPSPICSTLLCFLYLSFYLAIYLFVLLLDSTCSSEIM